MFLWSLWVPCANKLWSNAEDIDTLDHVIMCPLSRFLYLTRSIYFTGLSDGISVYVHGQYAHLSLDTLNLHVYLSILYNLYDSMIVWWVLIRGYMILAYVQVLFSYVSLYKCVCVDTFKWFHYVPDVIWSLWDFVIQDLCYLAAWRPKTTWFGTLDV